MKESSLSFSAVLGIVFIVLKLTNVIDWSWWWVLAPFWIPLAFMILTVLVIGLLMWIEDRA